MLQAGLALLAAGPSALRAQQQLVPIADMHSHYGMFSRSIASSGLADDMRGHRVALVAWKLVSDARWTRTTSNGIEQVREPAPGQLAQFFDASLERMKAYIAEQKLRTVLTPADVDACIAGDAGIVLAAEGADFLEGKVENLDAAYGKGLRHLQLVHYIRTPVGDFQTTAPVHNGLSAMGKQLVEACNAKGVLVDLAHSTAASVDQALDIAKAPFIWSHSWVGDAGGNWQDPYGFQRRQLSLDHARKIAARGGVVGLWGLGLSRPGSGWSVTARNTQAYAEEIASLVNKIGADHVGFGTDIEGVGPNWAINDYGHLRNVVEHLQEMKLEASVIERVAYANYARVLKARAESLISGSSRTATSMRTLSLLTVFLLASCATVPADEPADGPVAGWPYYGGDAGGSRYSRLTQINRGNVSQLQVAWEYHTGDVSDGSDGRAKTEFETTPIVAGGTMYLTTPFNRVIALDPETGKEKWTFDPKLDLRVHYSEGLVNRGVALWNDAEKARDGFCGSRIFLATIDARLFALDAATGRPCTDFAQAGQLDLAKGVGGIVRRGEYQETSAPAIAGRARHRRLLDRRQRPRRQPERRREGLRRENRGAALELAAARRRHRADRRGQRVVDDLRRRQTRTRVPADGQREPRLSRPAAAGRQQVGQFGRCAVGRDGRAGLGFSAGASRPVGLRHRVATRARDVAPRRPRDPRGDSGQQDRKPVRARARNREARVRRGGAPRSAQHGAKANAPLPRSPSRWRRRPWCRSGSRRTKPGG